MNVIKRIIKALQTWKSLYVNVDTDKFGAYGNGNILELPAKITKPNNLYIGNDVAIRGFFTFISHTGTLTIKDHVDISQHFTVVTGNHTLRPSLDKWQVECNHLAEGDIECDIIIEEDVWIGINVTIMPGVTIGRGSIIGAGSLVTKSIPPNSIAVGVPCRVIRKKYSEEEFAIREKGLYSSL